MENLIFSLLGLLAILGAIGTVTMRSPVNSVFCLLLTMLCLAGNYIMLDAPFLAAVQIIVYAGAIIILFLFVVVLLNLRSETLARRRVPKGRLIYIPMGLAVMIVLTGLFRSGSQWISGGTAPSGTIEAMGLTLFSKWVYPFELTGVLLLAAMVGAVAMTRKDTSGEGEN